MTINLTAQNKDDTPFIYPWNPVPDPVDEESEDNTPTLSERKAPATKNKQNKFRPPSPTKANTEKGIVKWFNEKKGYGFIEYV